MSLATRRCMRSATRAISLSVGGGDAPEHWFALAVNHIDTIHCQDMKMGIEIQGITEALNESYGAAASLAVRGRNVRPAADRGKNGAHKSAIYP